MRWKKILIFVLAISILTSLLLTSCGKMDQTDQSKGKETSNESKETTDSTKKEDEKKEDAKGNNVTPAGQFPIVEEPITISCLYTGDPRQDYSDNGTLKYIEEQTGIKLELVVVPEADYETKKNLMFSTGDYPEIILANINRADILQFGMQEQIFIPLDEYIEEYAFELKKIFEQRPGYDGIIKSPDGHVYVLPRFSECGHCMAYPKLWLNYQWLEKLGLEEPKTTDDLFNVLMAFKEGDPNGNGIKDEIPITGASAGNVRALEFYLMNSFIECDEKSYFINVDNNGKASFAGIQPEFREGLKYLKKLYDNGLIDIAAFTQNAEQLQQTIRQKPTLVGSFVAPHVGAGVDTKDPETYPYYHALPPVEGPEGTRVQPYTSTTAMILTEQPGRFAITDKCQNPAAAFRLFDFLISEYMTYVQHYGLEGQGWQKPPEGTKDLYGNPAKCIPMQAANDEEAERWAANRFFGILGDIREVRNGWMVQGEGENWLDDPVYYESRLQIETDRVSKYWDLSHPDAPQNLPLIYCSQDEATEFNNLQVSIIDNFKSATVMFIVGERDIDKDWDAYLKEMEGYGINRWLELYEKAYAKFAEMVGDTKWWMP